MFCLVCSSLVDRESGFHISCYRHFNSLSESACIKIKRKSPKKELVFLIIRSQINSSSPATTIGVLVKLFFAVARTAKRKMINVISL